MADEIVTIQVSAKEALLRHIQSLEGALAKRNLRIEQLEARIAAGEESPLIEQARTEGYTAGWKACANRLTEITHTAALNLRDIRKDALSIYYDELREAPDA